MTRPIRRAAIIARTDQPAPAATGLARVLLESGWTLSGASVRVVHTARLATDSGLTVAIASEAGRVRIELDSEYHYIGNSLSRTAWHAEADGALPVSLLTAVAAANSSDAAYRDDHTVTELLTAAGWAHPEPHIWTAPRGTSKVAFCDDYLEFIDLPWRIRRTGRPEITASHDTPPTVIAAMAGVEAPGMPHSDTAATG